MNTEFDVCIIGSGAGGAPVALTLAKAGHSVVILEKGPWFTEKDFYKDDLAVSYRNVFVPDLEDEPHIIEEQNKQGNWVGTSTSNSGWSFWNGNCVGGSSNFMSGYFHRLKPKDFKLASTFGPIDGANIADWPITYEDLEPYYTLVETEVGISGRVISHPFAEPRSTKTFPYPPTKEHPISEWIDTSCHKNGLHPLPAPRAILPYAVGNRNGCMYSGYCGGYGCYSGAKGSARAALLSRAIATQHCQIRPHAKVYHLLSDKSGKVIAAQYYDQQNRKKQVAAKIFVVACQAIETSRLLLLSTGPRHKNGLANNSGQVGKNLIFSTAGFGSADFLYKKYNDKKIEQLKKQGPFVNRALQDWYFINDAKVGGHVKGGTIDLLFSNPDPIAQADSEKWGNDGLLWGAALKEKLYNYFTKSRHFGFEIFGDWLPTDNCFVALDPKIKDKWGTPVARIRIGYHFHAIKIARYLADRGEEVFRQLGADNISSVVSVYPPTNLQAGGCRFGDNPKTSVLNANCRAHDVENLYVTDGSFMPTGGSVPYTWTIYANAFRVAEHIQKQLG